MTEKLMPPVIITAEPHTDQLLIRLQKTRETLVRERDHIIPNQLYHDLIGVIDDSYNVIACCQVREDIQTPTPKKERYEYVTDEVSQNSQKMKSINVQSNEQQQQQPHIGGVRGGGKGKKKKPVLQTPTDRITRSMNIVPVQKHKHPSDRVSEEPIDL
ncbi:hypothetical protein CLIB1423_32S01046 [[Candida] railenensis]|uniref:Uncharacterized protein n=1 Tax=[Candida] railenensis TaxID=45579 RepID=A0A9P0QVF1_9ASCO|nr:hypothetical protein CLIB1423_32S01046 [[Candida] railenensis]